MEKEIVINGKEYILNRYPETQDKALRAWSNAEVLVLNFIQDNPKKKIHLFNDRFGVWNCALHEKQVETIWTYASQKKAIESNLTSNNLSSEAVYKSPLDKLDNVELALVKIPKSIELFELFLYQIQQGSNEQTEIVCGFMTKYFSPAYLKTAQKYFTVVEQSKAWKKARLLILKEPKKEIPVSTKDLVNTIKWNEGTLKQYLGVFSSDRIDIGTQFLLENLVVEDNEIQVLDVASGNGILSYEVLQQNEKAYVTLVDDFNLAIESSKLNLPAEQARFICTDCMEGVEDDFFDLIVSNPPFHFEHENNIEVSLRLFQRIKDCLKHNGRFVMVANLHLNYITHLEKLFRKVSVINRNSKFIIYECRL
ncbi:23S rRNA (guanine1835-N2)-methyltransferase [Tenacibaculum skagerrakense]|uniref:23S rRNA (Guanine1835-N2)-methyltransferase n=1 Tax=Tenacibaculum skagerrakense TaxID=186571 RepID=A0A4R2NXE0_9FLAO|nr:methyltransferase [Tenacibaculum skagerrakense]TCP26879.1 23S rRNA (guanine1835-N2)-methyltransferase [Tenacibaculum skagerrakense]